MLPDVTSLERLPKQNNSEGRVHLWLSLAAPLISPSPFQTSVTPCLDPAALRAEKRTHMGRQPGIVFPQKADKIS